MIKIGYLGPKGTFTEEALTTYRQDDQACQKIPYSSISELFSQYSQSNIDEIIFPVENSLGGSVNISFDLLTKSSGLYIKQEILKKISQCLMASSKIECQHITDLISHPQPIEQCQRFIEEQLKHAHIHKFTSTAKAAQLLQEQQLISLQGAHKTTALIGSKLLEKHYDLTMLQENINDNQSNTTRFFVCSKHKTTKTGDDKTSIVFSLERDEPGGLYNVLDVFSKKSINMTHISSRPAKKTLGDYLFFIDIEGHIEDPLINEALTVVEQTTSYYKLLGSYPRGKNND